MDETTLEDLVNRLIAFSKDDYAGIWIPLKHVKEDLKIEGAESQKEATLSVCRQALERGLIAGQFEPRPDLPDDLKQELEGVHYPGFFFQVGTAVPDNWKEFADRNAQGLHFVAWGGSTDEIMTRISSEWDKLGREPNMGDVVWFTTKRD